MTNPVRPRSPGVGRATLVAFAIATATLASADDGTDEHIDEPASAPAPAARRVMEEIVVTANRRAQNVQDVASGISVFDGDELEKSGVSGFESYVFKIPGADLADSGIEKKISIRGISNVASSLVSVGGSTSPIGIYLNDTPIQGNGVLPDLALYDLERIEVLKGPQGTLYGEGAQGGAIKMLLNKADPGELFTKGEVTLGHTRSGGALNHSESAAVNAPLFRSWAIRLVGSRREEQGFVDFPRRGTRDENDATNLMGRVHVDGEISEGFSVSGMLFHQRQRLDQFPQVRKGEGDLVNSRSEPQFADNDFTLAGLTLEYDLGFARATSSTSWFENHRRILGRFPFVGPAALLILLPLTGSGDVPTVPGIENEWVVLDNDQDSIAQELRLVSSGTSWLDWVVGGFYRARDNHFDYLLDNDVACCPPPVETGLERGYGVESFEQFAGFGEATVDLPWNLQLLAGIRILRETAALEGIQKERGPLFAAAVSAGEPDGAFGPRSFDTATTDVTPKASLAWFVDDSRMVYGLVANGLRSGGTNHNAIQSTATPLFAPDSLWTYEVGAKTDWLDGLLTANLSLFRNQWTDLQVSTVEDAQIGQITVAIPVVLNAGRAFSQGAELETLALPVDGLALGMSLAVMDGEITRGDPAGNIADGAPLPQLSKLSYAASAGYELVDRPVFGLTPFVHFDMQRAGDRLMSPPTVITPPEMAGFHVYNALSGLANDRWEVSFSVRNLTDARPELGSNLLDPDTKTIGPPRTWTTKLAFRF